MTLYYIDKFKNCFGAERYSMPALSGLMTSKKSGLYTSQTISMLKT